jgi:hypothetical protein
MLRPLPLIAAMFIAAALAFAGCSDAEDAEKNQDDLGTAGIRGKWTGNLENKQAEENGSSLTTTNADAVFDQDDDNTGTFEITLPLLDDIYAKGTYADFGDTLLLQVKDSTLGLIGMPSAKTKIKYEYLGNTLRLFNDQVSIILAREDADDEGDGGGGGGGGEDAGVLKPLLGQWTCDPQDDSTWTLDLSSATEFSLTVSKSGSRSAWQHGDVEKGPNATGILTVTSSLAGLFDGSIYKLKVDKDDETKMTLEVAVGNGETDNRKMACTRI